jgi:hypothetical protein
MRSATFAPLAIAALALLTPAAHAQSEDEKILEQPAGEQAASPDDSGRRQSRADDEMDDEELDAQVFYSGMGIERASTDFDNLGEATNLAIVLGFRIPTAPWFGLEIDLGQTLIPGEYREPDAGSPGTPAGCGPLGTDPCPGTPAEQGATDAEGDEFGMQALGLSLALKSTGRFYVTGKYGYRYIATSNDTVNENRSGKGLGLGVGYRWGKGLSGVELGYKQLAEDVDSIGLTFFVRTAGR